MNRNRRLLSNTMVFTVGKFVSKLLVFVMTRFYTARLSPSEYSIADLIANMANFLIPLACLGITEGIFRSAAAREGNKDAFFTNGLFVLGAGSLLFLCVSPLLGLIPFFTDTAWLIVLYVLVSNCHSVVSQYLCAVGRTKLFAGQGILNTALTILLNLVFLLGLDMGVTGYVLSIILADGVTTLFLIVYTRLWHAVKPRTISWPIIRSMLTFCLPLVPTTLFWWITGVSDRYMVAYMASPEMNGLYTAAYKIPTLLIYAVGIFDSAWKLSVSGEADDEEGCRRFYSSVWRVYTTVAFLGGAALMLASPLFASLLFAEGYDSAWVYIPVLTSATVYTALDTFLGSVYFARKRTMWSMITALVGAVANFALNLWLIPIRGAMGASIATLASYLAVCVLRLITTHRLIRFDRELGRMTANTLLLGGMTASVTLTTVYSPLVTWGVSIVLAAAMLVVNFRAIRDLLVSALRMLRGRDTD